MDKLSWKLNTVKVGCIVNETVINHLIYADDSVLIALSAKSTYLQVLLSHCKEFAESHDIIYNLKKSVCMTYVPKCINFNINHPMFLSDKCLEYVVNHKYLCVKMSNDCNDDIGLLQQCKNIYSHCNAFNLK